MSLSEDFFRSWQQTNKMYNLQRKIKDLLPESYIDLINDKTATHAYDTLAKMTAFYNPSKDYSSYSYINELLQKESKIRDIIPKIFEKSFYIAIDSQEKLLSTIFSVNNSFSLASNGISQANVLCRAASNVSSSIFNDVLKLKAWDKFHTISPYYARIAEIADVIETENEVSSQTLIDFETLQNEVQTQLGKLIQTGKQHFVKSFLSLLAIIGFLISLYSLYLQLSDISNKEEIRQLEGSNAKAKKEIIEHIDSLFRNNRNVQIITSSPIRSKPIKNSSVICKSKVGESITIIDSCKKYYLVMYKRGDFDYPIAGWVLKKHTKYERGIY